MKQRWESPAAEKDLCRSSGGYAEDQVPEAIDGRESKALEDQNIQGNRKKKQQKGIQSITLRSRSFHRHLFS